MHAEAIRGAGNAQQNFICVILSSRGRRIRRKLKRLLTNCQKSRTILAYKERERERDRQRKPEEVEESQQRDDVACLKFAIKVSHRQTRTCVSFVFMHHASHAPLSLSLAAPLSLTSNGRRRMFEVRFICSKSLKCLYLD